LLPDLRPVSARLRAVLPRARRVVRAKGPNNDLTELLLELPDLAGHGVPLVGDLTAVTEQARPILAELRPYIPELTSGIVAGFGGSTGGYYDANGHYARISFLGGPFSAVGLSPLFPPTGTLTQGALDRCPGGATYNATDGSNPFVEPGIECDPSLAGAGP
jgi:phospholipid/cholesterol/gamma-HCH transport system substrate-binding protein